MDDERQPAVSEMPLITTFCHACGTRLPDDAAYCPSCGTQARTDRTPDALAAQPRPVPASLIRRGLAWLIDAAVMLGILVGACVALWLALMPSGGSAADQQAARQGIAFLAMCLFLLFGPLYSALLHRYWHGQTLGKRATRIRVVDYDGRELRIGQCLGRSYLRIGLYMLMWIPWLLDSVWPLFAGERRALHDHAAGTIVVPA